MDINWSDWWTTVSWVFFFLIFNRIFFVLEDNCFLVEKTKIFNFFIQYIIF